MEQKKKRCELKAQYVEAKSAATELVAAIKASVEGGLYHWSNNPHGTIELDAAPLFFLHVRITCVSKLRQHVRSAIGQEGRT